jgi:hypothetical protein
MRAAVLLVFLLTLPRSRGADTGPAAAKPSLTQFGFTSTMDGMLYVFGGYDPGGMRNAVNPVQSANSISFKQYKTSFLFLIPIISPNNNSDLAPHRQNNWPDYLLNIVL